MIDKQILGVFSVALSVVGLGNYIRTVLNGRTKPHVFTWLIWGVMMGVVAFAQFSEGGEAGAWGTGATAFGCLVVALLALWFGEKQITGSDWYAFVGALSIIPVWYFTKNPLWAVIIATAIDCIGYYPTFRKVLLRPYEEDYLIYVLDAAKWIIGLFALSFYDTTTTIYPAVMFVADIAMALLILWLRRAQIST